MEEINKPFAILLDDKGSLKVVPLSSILYFEETDDGYDIILIDRNQYLTQIRIKTKYGLNDLKKYFTILNG